MTNPDPVIAKIAETADTWHTHLEHAAQARADLNKLVIWARNEGYAYRDLAAAAGVSVATIQLILAKKTPAETHSRLT